jgi:hypothetical protein
LSDKRSHARYPVRIPVVVIYRDVEQTAVSGDIGLGGMFVHTEAPLPFGERITVRIKLPALKAESQIVATVRWKSREGVGVQFLSLRAREVWALNRLLRSNAASAPG